jgi:hypothetical protein
MEPVLLRRLAQATSVIFHPLWVSTFVHLLVFRYFPFLAAPLDTDRKMQYLIFIWVSTFLLPSILLLLMYFLKLVPSLTMSSKKDRTYPMLLVSCIYLLQFYFLYTHFRYNTYLVILSAGALLSTLVVTFVGFFFKISAHALGISIVGGVFWCLLFLFPDQALMYPFIVVVLCMGVVCWARLYLSAHTPQEVFIGFLSGSFIAGITVLGFFSF